MVAKALAEVLSVDHVSAGDFMREMAAERGMSILELSRVAESDDAIDLEIDARTSRLAGSGRSFVMDARLGWHFIPHSVKVFLDVRPEVAAARVFGAGRSAEKENVNLDATVRAIAKGPSRAERCIEYYGIDYLDPSHYDLVVTRPTRPPSRWWSDRGAPPGAGYGEEDGPGNLASRSESLEDRRVVDRIGNRFAAVVVSARRSPDQQLLQPAWRRIRRVRATAGPFLSRKPLTIAMEEIAEGKVAVVTSGNSQCSPASVSCLPSPGE